MAADHDDVKQLAHGQILEELLVPIADCSGSPALFLLVLGRLVVL